jgi:NADPH:quinone reductase
MVAAQLVAPRRFELCQVPKPAPGQGEVLVQVEGCGVCASNLPAWSGRPWFSYPLEPGQLGHEGWGRVEAVGAGVDRSLLGRRVATLSERSFAQFDVVGAADLVALPDSDSAGAPDVMPLEPFACIFNVYQRARISELWAGNGADGVVAVVGLGFVGLGIARLSARAGVRTIALSTNPHALKLARGFGVDTIEIQDRAQASAAVGEFTGGLGCACVVECTGFQEPLDLASDLVAEGGRLVIAGFHQDGARSVDMQQWNWKGIDVINAHERSRERIRSGMRTAARELADDAEWTRLLITDRFPLADIGLALERASERPAGFIKAAVLTGQGAA